MLTHRELQRGEIELVWQIDRSETIDHIYCYDKGALALRPVQFESQGWQPGAAEHYMPMFLDCYDRGGWFYGLFADGRIAGVVILDHKWMSARQDQLQLVFLHISRAYRGQGLGQQLFASARAQAREWGAKRLYISASPSKNTVDFYFRRGCTLAQELDAELYALEPEDIHLECRV